ncbi:unnamed protein product [Debaryomyces tyrocola]|nr:unnamed protein product [Debaryomyces tyrocola]
MPIDLHGRIQ